MTEASLAHWIENHDQEFGDLDRHTISIARTLLEDFWVNLSEPPSRNFPVRELERLESHTGRPAGEFYAQLLRFFSGISDRHTRFTPPSPWKNHYAFVPFLIDRFFENDRWNYLVTYSAVPQLLRGDLILKWNGRPIETQINDHATIQLGGNRIARFAKALQTFTVRPMQLMPPPAGQIQMTISNSAGDLREERFPWMIADDQAVAKLFAGCHSTDIGFEPCTMGMTRELRTSQGNFTHLKIGSLRMPPDKWISASAPFLEQIESLGLILDLRGCEEGFVQTGERSLQLFTNNRIKSLSFHFRITPWTRKIVGSVEAFKPWRSLMAQAVKRGHRFTAGAPITNAELANAVGRKLACPVILIVDALTYSTAEMFAAGFQDHRIGLVLGTSRQTGGGGCSPWNLKQIHRMTDDSKFLLGDDGRDIQVSVLRCKRGLQHSPSLIEGNGVVPDVVHLPTRKDLLEQDHDLLERAIQLLLKRDSLVR